MPLELHELERDYPHMTLENMYDVVRLCAGTIAGEQDETRLRTDAFRAEKKRLVKIISKKWIFFALLPWETNHVSPEGLFLPHVQDEISQTITTTCSSSRL
ncbi:MAG TPA: hypothetical protein VGC66_13850 [Pyrinomonadaceae bacterium]